MPDKNAPLQAPTDFMSRISEWLSPADMKLDQVKKSVQADLQKLRSSQEVAANLYVSAEAGFKKDLDELGVRGDQQNEYLALFRSEWQKAEMGTKSAEILASPELRAMDAFISQLENLPKLKELIANAKPQAGWQGFLQGLIDKVPGLSSIPGLKDFLNGGAFDTILSAVGLGSLVSSRKKDQGDKKEGEAGPKAADAGKKEGQPADTAPEKVPETFKPGKTLVMGDSNPDGLAGGAQAALRERLNVTGMITKGAMQSGWGLDQIRNKPEKDFAEFENVVIQFGTNDLGETGERGSAATIWGRLQEMVRILRQKNPKLQVFLATVPPGKGNQYGRWTSDFNALEKDRLALNEEIRNAKASGKISGVIDLAAPRSKGGLAADDDASSLAADVRRFPNEKVHAKAEVLADAILRAEYQESKEQKS